MAGQLDNVSAAIGALQAQMATVLENSRETNAHLKQISESMAAVTINAESFESRLSEAEKVVKRFSSFEQRVAGVVLGVSFFVGISADYVKAAVGGIFSKIGQ